MMRVNNISVVDQAMEPGAPVYPRVSWNLVVGLFLGVLLGAAVAFLRGLLDRTVKVPDELADELGVACLGLLPQVNERTQKPPYRRQKRRRGRVPASPERPELVVHDEPMSSTAEAARAIRTNLMFMAPDKPYQTLLVTSAGPYEGKTTVAC